MSASTNIRIREEARTFFEDRNWHQRKCVNCGSLYYAKAYDDNCGSYDCDGGYAFLQIPSPRTFVPFVDLKEPVRCFLEERGYQETDPIAVKRRDKERTLFASAAGQIFDGLIYGGTEKGTRNAFCLQPVIRLQCFPYVGGTEGFSTSFVNVGTEGWNVSPQEHFKTLDDWMDLLSELGLYVGNLTFKQESAMNDWDGMEVPAESLKIEYRGLEIGIVNYFYDILQRDDGRATLSDISVGLERLAWAINKSDSYFDAIGPLRYSVIGDVPYMDSLRTMALMCASGVRPGPQNHGSKLRMFAQRVTRPFEMMPLDELTRFYYSQWARFMDLTANLNTTMNVIRNEVNRQTNIAINQILGNGGRIEVTSRTNLDELVSRNSGLLPVLRGKIRGDDN